MEQYLYLKQYFMNYLITAVLFLNSFIGYSQQDSLIITSGISIDSIYNGNHKLDFSRVNDTVMKMSIERNLNLVDNRLIIHSGNIRYETNLPQDPVTDFPAEWSTRDPKNPINLQMDVNKGTCVTMSASGSAVNMLLPLATYNAEGVLISDESCCIHVEKPGRKKRKVRG